VILLKILSSLPPPRGVGAAPVRQDRPGGFIVLQIDVHKFNG